MRSAQVGTSTYGCYNGNGEGYEGGFERGCGLRGCGGVSQRMTEEVAVTPDCGVISQRTKKKAATTR